MGEITEALRRAKRQRESRGDAASTDARPARESTVVRAGLDLAPPAAPVHRDPLPIPEVDEKETGAAQIADAERVPISRVRSGLWPARAVFLDPRQPHTERFRRFALRVRSELANRRARTVLVTSALRSDGKTFTACNLALALASMAAEGRIALLELDTRRPSVAPALGIAARAGVEEVIAGKVPLDAARVATELPSLDLFLVREPPERAHEILALPGLQRIFTELERRYDCVVVDSPPVLLVPDVPLILGHVDACVAVVRAGTSRLHAVRDMLDQIPREKLLGVFVNDVAAPRNADQYAYYTAEDEPR